MKPSELANESRQEWRNETRDSNIDFIGSGSEEHRLGIVIRGETLSMSKTGADLLHDYLDGHDEWADITS